MTEKRDSEHIDGWTVGTLKTYVEKLIEANDRLYDQRFKDLQKSSGDAMANSKEAITKAENATEKRFEGVNEFRQTLTDQAATFITRVEAEQRLKVIEQWKDQQAGSTKATEATVQKSMWTGNLIVAIVAIVAAFAASYFFKGH